MTPALRRSQDAGFALPMVLVLLALGAFVTASTLQLNRSVSRTSVATDTRLNRQYEAESALNSAGAWLREHSLEMYSAFLRANVYTHFDRGSYSSGANDSAFPVPTKVKLAGGSDTALLTNDANLGVSSFPTTTTDDGSSFDASTEFAAANFGNALVKITLVDLVPEDPSKDYGSGSTPETDFFPVFRVDAMSELDSGAHVYSYFVGSLATSSPMGFFGKDSLEANQPCDSYDSRDGNYGGANRMANCPVASEGSVCIKNNTNIYGTVDSTGTVESGGSCGGKACADLACAQENTPCSGPGCKIGKYPSYQSFDYYCPSDQGTVNVSGSLTLTVSGGLPSQNCWNAVNIGNHETLYLTSTSHPYYIRSLSLASNGKIDVQPDVAGGVVTVLVETLSSPISGQGVVNSSARPSQFKLIYLGTSEIKMNGSADFKLFFEAPNAPVTVLGNANYYGGITARALSLTGSGNLHYDESAGLGEVSDVEYRIQGISQYYR